MLDDSLLDSELGENENRTWGTHITVDGTVYATSLFWQPLQNPNEPMQEIEETSNAILEGSDLFCIKSGRAPQFGICISQEGYKSNQFVAACSLMSAVDNLSSFLAVFKVPEGWWYVCVRNDIILSDGDMLFLNEEEAKKQFMSMLAVPDWGMKIAPQDWRIEETQEVDLNDIMQRGAKVKLQKIRSLRGKRLFFILALSLVVGGWLISSLIDKLLFTPVKRPVVVPVRPKVIVEQPVEEVQVPKPWEHLASPISFMNNCYEGIKQLKTTILPGWKIGMISCTGTAAATSWTRDVGFMSIAEEAIDKSNLKLAGFSFDERGEALSLSVNLPTIEQLDSPPTYSLVELRNTLNNEFQTLNLPISLGEGSVQVDSGQPKVAPKTYQLLRFSISSPHDPKVWTDLLTKYSGLEINLITYSPEGGIWNYEGVIYVL